VIWFVLFLVLLALATGILGAVVKVTLVIILSLILAAVLIGFLARIWWRRRMRDIQRQMSAYMPSAGGPVDTSGRVRTVENEAGASDPDRQRGSGDEPPSLPA
jgi:membrane protein implicated in regulation of membrane protease activity